MQHRPTRDGDVFEEDVPSNWNNLKSYSKWRSTTLVSGMTDGLHFNYITTWIPLEKQLKEVSEIKLHYGESSYESKTDRNKWDRPNVPQPAVLNGKKTVPPSRSVPRSPLMHHPSLHKAGRHLNMGHYPQAEDHKFKSAYCSTIFHRKLTWLVPYRCLPCRTL